MTNPVRVKCKNCGKDAQADQFKLHYQFKMMVCPNCFSGKTQKEKETAAAKVEKEQTGKPAGWDKDDDYLENYAKSKKDKMSSVFSRIPGSDLLKCTCVSCKYIFKYDPFKRIPRTCPYCDGDVPKVNTYNSL